MVYGMYWWKRKCSVEEGRPRRWFPPAHLTPAFSSRSHLATTQVSYQLSIASRREWATLANFHINLGHFDDEMGTRSRQPAGRIRLLVESHCRQQKITPAECRDDEERPALKFIVRGLQPQRCIGQLESWEGCQSRVRRLTVTDSNRNQSQRFNSLSEMWNPHHVGESPPGCGGASGRRMDSYRKGSSWISMIDRHDT
ncbi:hypothetical protein T12_11835 [Trichinella patagoniensis]|uniref:Uncharacterized protein n=1 Tax=Trichinella patagoniensis TaxID=990121 RepID=A0A0V0ZWP7_9BILA|nr:hypothetical protein T12_11835 [Trichinella patagoniensis]